MRELGLACACLVLKEGRRRDAAVRHRTPQLQDRGQRRAGGVAQGPEVGLPTS